MLKKLCFLTVILTILLGCISVHAANNALYINVNNSRIYPDVQPFIENNRTMVPLRVIAENLGTEVTWNEDTKSIEVKSGNIVLKTAIASNTATLNGVTKHLDIAPKIVDSRTFVPLRFIAENMGMQVNWVSEARLATITAPDYFDKIPANTVLGYTTNDYKGDNASYNSLLNNYNNLSSIATFSYQIDVKGNLNLTGVPQQNTVDFANNNGIKPLVLIHNYKDGGFDKDLAHSVLSNKKIRTGLINNILVTISKKDYAGVNVDIEHINWYDRAYYSAFIQELKGKLAPCGFLTTVSIAAKTNDDYQNNNWNGAFDYKEIGKYADQVMLMTYDEHYITDVPGSIASYPWVEDVLKYATKDIPSKKLLLGIAGYGYDWASSGSRAIALKNIQNLFTSYNAVPQWDSQLKSPYFTYQKSGITHEVWYENADSISEKLDLVGKYKLGGIGLWKLGYDDDSFWSVIKQKSSN